MTKLSCHPPRWQSYHVIHHDDKVIMLSTMMTKLSCQPWWRQPPVSSLKFGGDLILHVPTHPSPYLQILTNAKNIREGRLWKRCGWTTFVMDCKRKGVEIQINNTLKASHNWKNQNSERTHLTLKEKHSHSRFSHHSSIRYVLWWKIENKVGENLLICGIWFPMIIVYNEFGEQFLGLSVTWTKVSGVAGFSCRAPSSSSSSSS